MDLQNSCVFMWCVILMSLSEQVTDNRDTFFKDTRREVFRGAGQVLGGETRPSRLVPESKTAEKSHDKAPTNTPEDSQLKIATQAPGKDEDQLNEEESYIPIKLCICSQTTWSIL